MNDIGTTSWGPVPTLASFLVQLSSLPPLQSLPCLTTAEARAMGTSVKSKAAFVDVVLEGMDQEGGWQIPEGGHDTLSTRAADEPNMEQP